MTGAGQGRIPMTDKKASPEASARRFSGDACCIMGLSAFGFEARDLILELVRYTCAGDMMSPSAMARISEAAVILFDRRIRAEKGEQKTLPTFR